MRRKTFLIIGLFFLVSALLVLWVISPEIEILSRPNKIGILEIDGLINEARETLGKIVEFRKDPNVKAIVVRIDSVGGGVGPSQEIYRELIRTREEKPVVASLGAVAASGGYYIASACNRILANPGTVTGSIGVIVYYPNLKGFFEKIGYSMEAIKSGRFKDIGNPARELTAEEKTIILDTVEEIHGQFIRDVARGRNLPEEKIREIADGRIFTGEMAQKLGLVDGLGNFEDAVEAARAMGKIDGEPELVYAKKKKFSLLGFLLGTEFSNQMMRYLEGRVDFFRYQSPYGF